MVMKAEDLMSLNELGLSTGVKTYLMRNFSYSTDRIIWHGRYEAYVRAYRPEMATDDKKSTNELIKALDKAGYIRHDINPGSFCVNNLYRRVFPRTKTEEMPTELREFCLVAWKLSNGDTTHHPNYHIGNKKYESFEIPTEEKLDAIKQTMLACLTKEEYTVIVCTMGFLDGSYHGPKWTGEYLNITSEQVLRIEKQAISKLKDSKEFSAFIATPEDRLEMEVSAIIEEIEELRKDPIFKREAMLVQRLREIAKEMPSSYATSYLANREEPPERGVIILS